MLSIPAKEPQDDRGEEVNELLFVFHLTLKMLSQCVPRLWLEWAGKAYISRRFALRLFSCCCAMNMSQTQLSKGTQGGISVW